MSEISLYSSSPFTIDGKASIKKEQEDHYILSLNDTDKLKETFLAAVNPDDDWAILTNGKPIKAVFFDMDGTLVQNESIVLLAEEAGSKNEVEKVTRLAMEGKKDFTEALNERVHTLKGLSLSKIPSIADRFVLSDGILTMLEFLKNQKIPYFLVSGGFNCFASRFARNLGFEGFLANELEDKDGFLTGKVIGKIVDENAKVDFVNEMARLHKWKLDEIATVGDGANDIPMMKVSGFTMGFNAKKIVHPHLNIHSKSSFKFITQIVKNSGRFLQT